MKEKKCESCLEWSLQKITVYALLGSARDNTIHKIKKQKNSAFIKVAFIQLTVAFTCRVPSRNRATAVYRISKLNL